MPRIFTGLEVPADEFLSHIGADGTKLLVHLNDHSARIRSYEIVAENIKAPVHK